MAEELTNLESLSPLQKAYLAVQKLQTKLDALEQARTEPIAVVGMGCRFPGGADDPDAFWRLLSDGVDAVSDVPAERREPGGRWGRAVNGRALRFPERRG